MSGVKPPGPRATPTDSPHRLSPPPGSPPGASSRRGRISTAETGAQEGGLASQSLSVGTMTRALVITGSCVPIGHLRSDDRIHLRRTEASPFDLSGANTTHGPCEPCVPGTRLRCPRGLDGLGVVDRPQRRPKRRDGHRVPCFHRCRKHGTQAIPHGPRAVLRRCRPIEVHRDDDTFDPALGKQSYCRLPAPAGTPIRAVSGMRAHFVGRRWAHG